MALWNGSFDTPQRHVRVATNEERQAEALERIATALEKLTKKGTAQ